MHANTSRQILLLLTALAGGLSVSKDAIAGINTKVDSVRGIGTKKFGDKPPPLTTQGCMKDPKVPTRSVVCMDMTTPHTFMGFKTKMTTTGYFDSKLFMIQMVFDCGTWKKVKSAMIQSWGQPNVSGGYWEGSRTVVQAGQQGPMCFVGLQDLKLGNEFGLLVQ